MSTDTQGSRMVGWAIFAGVVLIMAGIFDALKGLAAIIGPDSAYFLGPAGNLFLFDVAGWGWWHLIIGLLLVLVGVFVLRGATWARTIAIILVVLNAVGQLALLPVAPWWSLILIALDVLIVYALIVHGKELKA